MVEGKTTRRPPPHKRLPDCDQLRKLVGDGKTRKEIAEMYGVSYESARQALLSCGIEPQRERADMRHYLPWRHRRADHESNVLASRLRSYAKEQQGRPLTESEARLLDEWKQFMDGANRWGLPFSVHYAREDDDGFYLEPRRPGDRDYISPPAA